MEADSTVARLVGTKRTRTAAARTESLHIGRDARIVRQREAAMAVNSKTASVGARAPDFTLTDQHGNEVHLADAWSAGPVVLVFLRGFG